MQRRQEKEQEWGIRGKKRMEARERVALAMLRRNSIYRRSMTKSEFV